jgi:putative membrane protein
MEMKSFLAAICCIVLSCVPALARHGADAAPMSDQQFVDFAAQTDMTVAHLGQAAENNASSQAVKDYAQRLVTDHTKDYSELSSMAEKANLTVPKGLDAEQQKLVEPFEKLKGRAFDHRYIALMTSEHTKAIATYKKEAADAKNAEVTAYADQALTVLQKHLDGAEDLAKTEHSGKS